MSARDLWWAFVVAGFRSKLSLLAFVALMATATWSFLRGQVVGGAFLTCFTLFTYLRVPALFGLWLARRSKN